MEDLLELRKKLKLTQKEVAKILGLNLRTYQRYEKNEVSETKQKIYYNALKEATAINENAGVLSREAIVNKVNAVLSKYNVKGCILFGSYAREDAKENSDIDLLLDTDITGFEYFDLVEDLRNTLGKKVDCLRLRDIQQSNPVALEILKEGVKIYAR